MKTVFFDIDTQIDFVFPAGALYVPGAEEILPAVARLNHHAASMGSPVVSTTDAHGEDDPEFRDWPAHCVAGTVGQAKPASTLLDSRVVISTSGAVPDLGGSRQIVVEKQQLDCFSNPNLPAVLERLSADGYIVYGVVTEYCVRCACMGLLRTGKPVTLVEDAVRSLDRDASRRMIDDFRAMGGRLASAGSVTGSVPGR